MGPDGRVHTLDFPPQNHLAKVSQPGRRRSPNLAQVSDRVLVGFTTSSMCPRRAFLSLHHLGHVPICPTTSQDTLGMSHNGLEGCKNAPSMWWREVLVQSSGEDRAFVPARGSRTEAESEVPRAVSPDPRLKAAQYGALPPPFVACVPNGLALFAWG